MLDFRVARSQLLALRKNFLLLGGELFSMGENLFLQGEDEGLQCFRIQLLKIARCGGIHCTQIYRTFFTA
jgi:hypothetical protein